MIDRANVRHLICTAQIILSTANSARADAAASRRRTEENRVKVAVMWALNSF